MEIWLHQKSTHVKIEIYKVAARNSVKWKLHTALYRKILIFLLLNYKPFFWKVTLCVFPLYIMLAMFSRDFVWLASVFITTNTDYKPTGGLFTKHINNDEKVQTFEVF